MDTRLWIWRFGIVGLILVTVAGCAAPEATPSTPTPAVSGGGGGVGGGNGSGGAGGSGSEATPATPTTPPTLQPTPTEQPTPTLNPTAVPVGPYLVRQTETRADEVLGTPAGGVCTDRLWSVPANTPRVSWLFVFDPHGSYPGITGNTFGYAYSIPSAGETHDAHGSYTLTENPDGTLTVSITAVDHVTFTGFDGTMPDQYRFDLVPMGGTPPCSGG